MNKQEIIERKLIELIKNKDIDLIKYLKENDFKNSDLKLFIKESKGSPYGLKIGYSYICYDNIATEDEFENDNNFSDLYQDYNGDYDYYKDENTEYDTDEIEKFISYYNLSKYLSKRLRDLVSYERKDLC